MVFTKKPLKNRVGRADGRYNLSNYLLLHELPNSDQREASRRFHIISNTNIDHIIDVHRLTDSMVMAACWEWNWLATNRERPCK